MLKNNCSNRVFEKLPDHFKSLLRPWDFEELDAEERWSVDKSLGILDWDGNTEGECPVDIEVWFEMHTDSYMVGWKAPEWLSEVYQDQDLECSWYEFTRPVNIGLDKVHTMNGTGHCLFGMVETFVQSDDFPAPFHHVYSGDIEVRLVWK